MSDFVCEHEPSVRVSSSVDLNVSGPQRSTYCCERDACQQRAKAWVRETCPQVVVVPLPSLGGAA